MSDRPIPPSSALTAVVASLLGTPPTMLATVATRAEELRQSAAILRDQPCAAAQNVADVLERWLRDGGDLLKMLGLRPGRGHASDTAQRRLRERDDAARALAATLPGGPTARVRAFVALQRARDPRVLVIHETTEALPTSTAQLKRILREA